MNNRSTLAKRLGVKNGEARARSQRIRAFAQQCVWNARVIRAEAEWTRLLVRLTAGS